jgi:hypothetical protein
MIIHYTCLGYSLADPTNRQEFNGSVDLIVDDVMSISSALREYINDHHNLRSHLTEIVKAEYK